MWTYLRHRPFGSHYRCRHRHQCLWQQLPLRRRQVVVVEAAGEVDAVHAATEMLQVEEDVAMGAAQRLPAITVVASAERGVTIRTPAYGMLRHTQRRRAMLHRAHVCACRKTCRCRLGARGPAR